MAFPCSSSRSPHGTQRNAGSRITLRSIRATWRASQRRGFRLFGFADAIGGAAGVDRGALLAQSADVGVGISGLAQHFDAVLAEARRRPIDPRTGPAPSARNSRELDPAFARVVHLLEQPDRLKMRIVNQVIEVIERHAGNVRLAQQLEPFG